MTLSTVPTGASISDKLALPGETPALRLFALLEYIVGKDHFVSLGSLVEELDLPKPTMHRMLSQLESDGLLMRQPDGRHYGTGARLREFAETLMLNTVQHGARRAVLRHLVQETGETCNITALSSNEIIYLDRVETTEPLRFLLRPGSRVPAHASASGKLILSQLSAAGRHKAFGHSPLRAYTEKTITSPKALNVELDQIRAQGYAIDDEECLPGLVCVAVLVPSGEERSNMCVAAQAPVMRLNKHNATGLLPALRRAAESLVAIETEASQ